MKRHSLAYAVALLSAVLASGARAQVLPNAGQLLNEQQQQQRALQDRPRSTVPEDAVVATPQQIPQATSQQGLRVTIHSVSFAGDTSIADAEHLDAITRSVVGRSFDHEGLEQIAETITQYLRGRGYALARAWLAPQDLTNGNLVITITQGALQSDANRIQVVGSTGEAARLAAIANTALPAGQPLKVEDLERALLLIDDQPGISAHAVLLKGDQPGTSRLVIDAQRGPLVTGSASIDNYGNRSTGSVRGNADLAVNDPLHIGDQLTVDTSFTSGSQLVGVGYSLPLNSSGLRLIANGSYLNYHVNEDDYAALDLTGWAATASVGLTYPLVRSRIQNLNASVQYEHKQLNDYSLGLNLSNRKIDDVTFSLSGNRYDSFLGGGVFQADASLTFGHLNLDGNPADAAADALTAGAGGGFTKVTANLSRLQSINTDWSLYAGLSAQLSNQNLDSSEKFLLGGPTGVRAYPVGEAAGDDGVMGTVELRRFLNLGIPQLKTQALAFVDAGEIKLNQSPWAGSDLNISSANHYALGAAGLGLNVWYQHLNMHMAVAHTIGGNPGASLTGLDADSRASKWRAWLQVGGTF